MTDVVGKIIKHGIIRIIDEEDLPFFTVPSFSVQEWEIFHPFLGESIANSSYPNSQLTTPTLCINHT